MKVYESWQCPNCECSEQVDVDRYLIVGLPICHQCGGVEMERLCDERIIVE
jgi:hypothetical protein